MSDDKPPQPPAVTPAEFVRAWETSNSLAEVEQKTGIPAAIAAARASSYRKKYQINLKLMKPRRKDATIDVAELNALIEALGGAKSGSRPAGESEAAEKSIDQLEAEAKEMAARRSQLLAKLLRKQ